MIARITLAVWVLARIAGAQTPDCHTLDSGRVLGRHLAAALPEFGVLPPELVLATMPPPGGTRTLRAAEIASLAQRYSIKLGSAEDVCFAWAMEPLDRARVQEAMEGAFPNTGAHIEIVETSLTAVPKGRLEFARARLATPGADQRNPLFWPGDVIYGDNQRQPVWARVRVTAPCTKLVANEALRTGQHIRPEQVKTQPGACFPAADNIARSADTLLALVPLRPIPAGSEIRPEWLAVPNDVNRGDSVEIEVFSGATRLALSGKAEANGHTGDLIAIRNPTSNRIFQGRVTGKGRVVVQADDVKVN